MYPEVYVHSLEHAKTHGETEEYWTSVLLNRGCACALENAILDYGNVQLGMVDPLKVSGEEVVKKVSEKYGIERVCYVLASHVRENQYNFVSLEHLVWALRFPVLPHRGHQFESSHPLAMFQVIQAARILSQKTRDLTPELPDDREPPTATKVRRLPEVG
ncbi:MAG: DUF3849 domain-containing protein [Symbiobacteriaceae bacterium]|nr:DUF3849 domain-containing protein [Symbiobacteriaceae bacterium]